MLKAVTIAAASLLATSAFGADCKSITDAAKRLACFDGAKVAATSKDDPWGAAKAAMAAKLTDPDSAKWSDFYKVTTPNYGELVCGKVNAKNQMGGYNGVTGFVYAASSRNAWLLFSGHSDPDAGTGFQLYKKYCLGDPRADQRAADPLKYL